MEHCLRGGKTKSMSNSLESTETFNTKELHDLCNSVTYDNKEGGFNHHYNASKYCISRGKLKRVDRRDESGILPIR